MNKKIGYCSLLTKESVTNNKRNKTFTLSYDLEKPLLYSMARITVNGKVFSTDKAIWDTGATITAFSNQIAEQLNASALESGISISASDTGESNIYRATIELPGGIIFRDTEIWGFPLSDFAADVVIGMDIIFQGKLVVEMQNGIPIFSFTIVQ